MAMKISWRVRNELLAINQQLAEKESWLKTRNLLATRLEGDINLSSYLFECDAKIDELRKSIDEAVIGLEYGTQLEINIKDKDDDPGSPY